MTVKNSEKIVNFIEFVYEYFPEREGFATAILSNGVDYAVVKLKNGNEVRVFLEDDWKNARETLGDDFREIKKADGFIVVSKEN